MKPTLDERLAAQLEDLRSRELYRRRRVVRGAHGVELEVDGQRCLNFCSNDYLGLAADPRLAQAAQRALDDSGTGSGAAALISGYNREHQQLEEALAAFLGRPRALLFSTGWAANVGTLRALLGKDDTLVADELNHASLIDGGRLSGAQYRRVRHGDLDGYRSELAMAQGHTVVATDAVFSMDGDRAPLTALAELCREHRADLMVDDAHGFGVLGLGGRGSVSATGLTNAEVPIYVATLGKALGVAGAFVAGSEELIEFLVHRARSWVFSTAPPPALSAAALESLRILEAEPERRARLQGHIQHFREGARQRKLPVMPSVTAIQPLVIGDERRTLALSAALFEAGYWVVAIRPPTVPAGTARLRITLSAAHSAGQVDGLLDALADGWRRSQALADAA